MERPQNRVVPHPVVELTSNGGAEVLDAREFENTRRGILGKIGAEFAEGFCERVHDESVLELLLGHFEKLGLETLVLHSVETALARAGDGFALKANALTAKKKFGARSEERPGFGGGLKTKMKTRRRTARENFDQRERRDRFRKLQTGFASEDDFLQRTGFEFFQCRLDGLRPGREVRLIPTREHSRSRGSAHVAEHFDPFRDIREVGFVIDQIDRQRRASAGVDDLGFGNEEILVGKIDPIAAIMGRGIEPAAAEYANARVAVVQEFHQIREAPEGGVAHGEGLVAARARPPVEARKERRALQPTRREETLVFERPFDAANARGQGTRGAVRSMEFVAPPDAEGGLGRRGGRCHW